VATRATGSGGAGKSTPARKATPPAKAAPVKAPSKAAPAKAAPAKAPSKAAPATAPKKSNQNVKHVVPDKKAGDWKIKDPNVAKPTGAAKTQKDAEKTAKAQVKADGGGQVVIHDKKGRIRDADTVKPGNESPTKDKKH
jgi:hypothetical protein